MCNTVVINAGPSFHIIMHNSLLNVVSIPHDSYESAAWWLIREYGSLHPDHKSSNCFSSILLDDEGLTIICSETSFMSLETLKPSNMNVSPQKWKAFVINVMGNATETPGSICYLSNALAKEGISILHISTYQSEVFLVQQHDIEKASFIFKQVDNRALISFVANLNAVLHMDMIRDGFELQVLRDHVSLCRLSDDISSLEKISSTLIRMLLYDPRYSSIEKFIHKKSSSSSSSTSSDISSSTSSLSHKFIWGLWKCDDEVTLLLHDDDVNLFPDGALVVSPQRWKVIKLAGRPIAFDETGIVSAMARIEVNASTLNISTASTNHALVPEDQLDSSLLSLSTTFHCPVLR